MSVRGRHGGGGSGRSDGGGGISGVDGGNRVVGDTRSVPLAERHRFFRVGETLEVFHDGRWRGAVVRNVLQNRRYVVAFGDGEEAEIQPCKVRVSNRISSVPDHQQQDMTFERGNLVEVKSDEEGYHGSWFSAVVVGPAGVGRYSVAYQTLTTDDGSQPLVEMAYASHVRPCPPIISRPAFDVLEEVDVRFNDGWWVGVVSRVLEDGRKYTVYFWTTNEELEFDVQNIRPHQEFTKGQWVPSFLPTQRHKSPAGSRIRNVKIRTGVDRRILDEHLSRTRTVEIACGEDGELHAWYPATIVGSFADGGYLAEYRTVKDDRGSGGGGLLRREVDARCVRRCPPIIQRSVPFDPYDQVEAWHDNGWFLGRIRTTVARSVYTVYLLATESVVEFQHAYLRPASSGFG